jgi:hypothetical protein
MLFRKVLNTLYFTVLSCSYCRLVALGVNNFHCGGRYE